MNTLTVTPLHTLPASKANQWLQDGFSLFKQAPVKLFLFLLLPLIIEGILQILPAPYGMLASKWAATFVGSSAVIVIHHLATHKVFSLKSIFKAKNWLSMIPLSAILASAFFIQLFVAKLLLGNDGINLLLFSQPTEVTQWQLGIIFASIIPVTLPVSFASYCVLLGDKNVLQALKSSLNAFFYAFKPMCLIALISFLSLLLAPYTFLLSAIITGPILTCISYIAYRSVFIKNKEA